MSCQPHILPAQNAVAEGINCALMESACATMAQASLPECYWAEAGSTAVYLRNCLPTRSIEEKVTPFKKWYEK
uniref:Integrase catalytic domain-containing protein n=1 Tax=Amphimedon queenslandica TaxID=400682 RepID=A0A1X7USN8_AMPQE